MKQTCHPPGQPFEIEPLPGFKVLVRSADRFSTNLARAQAEKTCNDVKESFETLESAGIAVPDRFNPENELHIAALYKSVFDLQLAIDHIVGWDAVDENDQPVEPTRERIQMMMQDDEFAREFINQVTDWQRKQSLAKKEFRTASNGKPAADPNTAKPAGTTNCPAPKGFPEKTAKDAPSS